MIPSLILKRKDLAMSLDNYRQRFSIENKVYKFYKTISNQGRSYLNIISFSKVSFDVKVLKVQRSRRR